jgi:hypothetical protein
MSKSTSPATRRTIQSPVTKSKLDRGRVDEVFRELALEIPVPHGRAALNIVRHPKVSIESFGGSERASTPSSDRRTRADHNKPRSTKKK